MAEAAAGEQGVEAGHGLVDVEVEDDGEVGVGAIDGGFGDLLDLLEVHAPAAALVGEGRGGEAIREDAFAGGECGFDLFMDELGAGGHVEKHFTADVHAVRWRGRGGFCGFVRQWGCRRVREGGGLSRLAASSLVIRALSGWFFRSRRGRQKR